MGNRLPKLLRAPTSAHSRNAAQGKRGILFGFAADGTPNMLRVTLAYGEAYFNRALTLVHYFGFLL
jgi:S-adenosylmethionine synthetase